MRERVGITVFCSYVLCFFAFLMFSVQNKQAETVPVVSDINKDGFYIIIDAGHGGSDGGTVAYDGTNESVLNLQISTKLNDIISAIGFDTVLTRTDDNSIGDRSSSIRNEKVSDIHKRMDIMNGFENCMFVSIHQNYYQDGSSWGSQVFYSANNSQSEILAQSIQSAIKDMLQNNNKRMIKKSGSGIYLLYHAKKPAVLVECGFMSNKDELNNLKDDMYQKNISFAITDGIINYLTQEGAFYGF